MYIEASPRKGVHTENKRERTQPANVIEDLLYSQIKDQSMDYRGAAYAAHHNANPNAIALQCWLTGKSKTSRNAFLPSFLPLVYTSSITLYNLKEKQQLRI